MKQLYIKAILPLTLTLIIAITFSSCNDEIVATKLLTVSVDPVKITPVSAEVVGEIVELSSERHGEYGFCWNTEGSPTIDNDDFLIVGDRASVGTFNGTLSGLKPETDYGVRAFVKVDNEVCYGQMLVFQTTGQQSMFFADYFDNNLNNWDESTDENGYTKVENGYYTLKFSQEGYFSRISNNIDGLSNFVENNNTIINVTLKASPVNAGTDFWPGFIWDVDNETFKYILIGIENNTPVIYIGEYNADGYNTEEQFDNSPYVNFSNNSFTSHISVEIKNNNSQATISIDGNQLYTMQGSISSDRIGFYVENTEIQADNLEVYASNGYKSTRSNYNNTFKSSNKGSSSVSNFTVINTKKK